MTPTKPARKFDLQGGPGVFLTPDDMQTLGRLLSRNLKDKEDLLAAVTVAHTIFIDGCLIKLEPRLLQRLKSRCLVKNRFSEWLRDVVIKQLHDYAGY